MISDKDSIISALIGETSKSEIPAISEPKSIQTRRDFMIDILSKNDCYVQFRKVDGKLRRMHCTLRPDALPPLVTNPDTKVSEPKAENFNIIKAYCLEANNLGWRSFRVDGVEEIETTGDGFNLKQDTIYMTSHWTHLP